MYPESVLLVCILYNHFLCVIFFWRFYWESNTVDEKELGILLITLSKTNTNKQDDMENLAKLTWLSIIDL